jgi:hypothetical protein
MPAQDRRPAGLDCAHGFAFLRGQRVSLLVGPSAAGDAQRGGRAARRRGPEGRFFLQCPHEHRRSRGPEGRRGRKSCSTGPPATSPPTQSTRKAEHPQTCGEGSSTRRRQRAKHSSKRLRSNPSSFLDWCFTARRSRSAATHRSRSRSGARRGTAKSGPGPGGEHPATRWNPAWPRAPIQHQPESPPDAQARLRRRAF